jgi:hypothetical protein
MTKATPEFLIILFGGIAFGFCLLWGMDLHNTVSDQQAAVNKLETYVDLQTLSERIDLQYDEQIQCLNNIAVVNTRKYVARVCNYEFDSTKRPPFERCYTTYNEPNVSNVSLEGYNYAETEIIFPPINFTYHENYVDGNLTPAVHWYGNPFLTRNEPDIAPPVVVHHYFRVNFTNFEKEQCPLPPIVGWREYMEIQ